MGTKNKINSILKEEKRCGLCKIRFLREFHKVYESNKLNKKSLKIIFGEIDHHTFAPSSKEDCPLCNSSLKERLRDISLEINKK